MDVLRFITLTFFWGGSFIAIEETLHVFPPMIAATFRMGFAGLLMGVWALLAGDPWFQDRKKFFMFALTGTVSIGIPWSLLFWGEQFVAPAVASMINSCVPIFVAIWGYSFFKAEKVKKNEWIGVCVGFIGIFFIFSRPLLQTKDAGEIKGLFAILLMAVFYGLGTNMIKGLGSKASARWVMLAQALGGCLVSLPMALAFGEQWPSDLQNHMSSVFSLLYLAVFSTALAFVFYFKLIHNWGSVRAASVTYTVPFVAIALDMIIKSRVPHVSEFVGMAIIFAGLLWMKKKS